MGNTKIEWTGKDGKTFNPWIGCTKVSPGCLHCYAEELMDHRYHRAEWGKGKPRVRTSEANWKLPIKWNKQCAANGTRTKVFCASIADWIDDEVPIEWLADLLLLIESTPNLDWQLLTKRPQNWEDRLHQVARLPHEADTFASWWLDGNAPINAWVGVTCEDQARTDERVPVLVDIPAAVRFLSVEPMLEKIDLSLTGIDWVIVGGESGSQARPCAIPWIDSIVAQCKAADVAVFVKQLGAKPFVELMPEMGGGVPWTLSTGKGGDIDQFPERLQIREFPEENNHDD